LKVLPNQLIKLLKNTESSLDWKDKTSQDLRQK
jgi:hypothetical protein